MSRSLTPVPAPPEAIEKILTRSAELRANGASWESCARAVKRPTKELKALARTWKPAYRRSLVAARREVLEDSFAESVLRLRRQLRAISEPVAHRAADILVKIWATQLRHRKPNTRPPLPDDIDPECLETARYLTSLSDEDLAATTQRLAPPRGSGT